MKWQQAIPHPCPDGCHPPQEGFPRLPSAPRERLESSANASSTSPSRKGIRLKSEQSIAPALGMSYGGRIAIFPGQEPAKVFSTRVPELAHQMLHKAERRIATTKAVRETEAEAIAFVVSQTIGLDAGRASADDIHLYHDSAALLTEGLEVIQRTAALIVQVWVALTNADTLTYPDPCRGRLRS